MKTVNIVAQLTSALMYRNFVLLFLLIFCTTICSNCQDTNNANEEKVEASNQTIEQVYEQLQNEYGASLNKRFTEQTITERHEAFSSILVDMCNYLNQKPTIKRAAQHGIIQLPKSILQLNLEKQRTEQLVLIEQSPMFSAYYETLYLEPLPAFQSLIVLYSNFSELEKHPEFKQMVEERLISLFEYFLVEEPTISSLYRIDQAGSNLLSNLLSSQKISQLINQIPLRDKFRDSKLFS